MFVSIHVSIVEARVGWGDEGTPTMAVHHDSRWGSLALITNLRCIWGGIQAG